MLFTFFGLNALAKKRQWSHLKVATVGNSALNMAMPMLGMPMTVPFSHIDKTDPRRERLRHPLDEQGEMEKLDIPPVA